MQNLKSLILEKSGPAKTGPAGPVPTPLCVYAFVHVCKTQLYTYN